MPIEVEGPDGAILEFPDGTSRDVMAKAMAKRYPKTAPKKAPAAQQPGSIASGVKGVLSGAANVLLTPFDLLAQGLSYAGVPGAEEAVARNAADVARTNRALAPYAAAHPNWFTGGQVLGEAVASAPALGAAGAGIGRLGQAASRVAPRAGASLARVGKAVQTGGLGTGRTAAQSAALSKAARVGQLAERAAGGAIAGAGGAALSGQDISTGAEFGAGLPIVGTVVRRIGGKLVDLARLPALEAGRIIREALGKDIDKARAAFAALSPDDQRLARQALVDAGVEPDAFMGVMADVEKLRPSEVRGTLEAQAAAREARLAEAAGGATATENRAATEMARREVSRGTGPARESALERANVAGRIVPEAERIAAAAKQRADEITASGFVPRMRGLEERAGEQAALMGDMPAIFPDMENIQRTRGIAGAAGQRAEDATAAQIGLRQTARDMEDLVADMAAEGMQPLRVSPIVGQLRSMASQPGTRADELQRRTLVKLANALEGLADQNGVIDARDLYQIRKTGLNDIVDRLLGSRAQPASGTKERTASLLTNIRPMIDNAIETAGGAGWKDYLTRTRQGFETVNRQELAAKGAQLAKDSPTEFTALMRGERPQVVEDIMGKGTGQYDIYGMALADPRRFLALKQSAQELETLNRMGELAKSGGAAAQKIIGEARPFMARNITRMGLAAWPKGRIASEAGEMALAGALRPRVRERLADAALSGQAALKAEEKYPMAAMAGEQISRIPAPVQNVFAQSAARFVPEFPEIDPETGQVLLGIGTGPNGERYPMYGDPSKNRNAMRR